MNGPVNEDFERTQRLVCVLGQAHHLMATELRAGVKDAGLNLQERGILLTLARGSAKTPAALAKLLGVHPARMTRVLDSEPDREAVLARFVSGLSDRDENLLRRMLGETPGPGGPSGTG